MSSVPKIPHDDMNKSSLKESRKDHIFKISSYFKVQSSKFDYFWKKLFMAKTDSLDQSFINNVEKELSLDKKLAD